MKNFSKILISFLQIFYCATFWRKLYISLHRDKTHNYMAIILEEYQRRVDNALGDDDSIIAYKYIRDTFYGKQR